MKHISKECYKQKAKYFKTLMTMVNGKILSKAFLEELKKFLKNDDKFSSHPSFILWHKQTSVGNQAT